MLTLSNKVAVFALALFLIICIITACGGGHSAPTISASNKGSLLKTVSTSFSSGIIDNSTSNDVGSYCSIAIDPDDNYPAVAYYDAQYGNLMYAKWDGSDWDAKTTVDSTGDVGQYTSLAFDSSGNPSIGYYDNTNDALKWAYDDDDDGNWSENGWPMTLADNANDDFGKFCSHDISGYSFGFAFYKANTGDLLYYEYDIITSNTSKVNVDTTDDVGQYCSLKYHSGIPAISYYNATDYDLYYAVEGSPNWTVEPVEDYDDVGQHSSLDYDGDGYPSIACYMTDGSDGWICWARRDPLTGWYSVSKAGDPGENWGQYMSHKWYGSSKCGFAFRAKDGHGVYRLEFIRWTSGGEDEYAADTTTNCGKYVSFAWVTSGGSAGDGWVSHYNSGSANLRYTRIDD